MTGIKLVHVPYKGSGAGMVALLSGEISMYFANIPVAIQHVRNGRLRPVALSGTRRNPAVPGIPTLSESGLVGFDVTSWFGIAAPAKTPRAIVDQLNGAIVRAVNTPDLRARFLDQGAEPVGNSPEQYTAFIEREIAKWAKVIKAAGIKAQ
jgi:tripartite-type tricarboxylate transporter receptor subunit TctC